MTGDATEVGSIIGYLSLNRDQWIRDIRATEDDARKLGALSPTIRIDTNAESILAQLAAIRAAAGDIGRQSPDVRISTNAASQTAQVHALRDAIITLGAAGIPLAGVLGGAAIGAVPVLAAVALGFKGISDAEKNGTLQNSQYGADLKSMQLWMTQLKSVAASGLLNGADQAIQSSRPLFGLLTGDIRDTSNQLGEIIAHDAPALLTVLTQLNPLFVTFGNLIAHGAVSLEHWSQSGKGVTGFVAYVQTELPQVIWFLGNLVTLISHVAQAGASLGGGTLASLNMVVRAIDELPIGVLQTLVQLLVAGRVAMLAYRGVDAVINGITGAITKVQAAQAAQTASAELDAKIQEQLMLELQAEAQQEAAEVAQAKAREAQAWADLVLAADNASASLIIASQNEARAAQEAAAEATLAAEETAAAATAMAEEIDSAGVAASAGWKAALGPALGLAAGVALLSAAFFSNHDRAKQAAEAANSYAESVKASTDALSEANVAQTQKNLSDKGALQTLADLTAANRDLGVSNVDLVQAVNGPAAAYDNVTSKLKAFITENQNYVSARGQINAPMRDAVDRAKHLIDTLATQRKGLQNQIVTQSQLNALNEASIGITDDQAQAAAALFGLTGTTGVQAYLAMKAAQQKSTQQADAQTLAWQAQNAAASLLQQTLDKLSGKKISYAQAENSFQQQLLAAAGNTGSLTSASRKHQLALEAEAVAQQKYDAALTAKGATSASIAAAHLALSRAQATVASTGSALNAAQTKAGTTLKGNTAAAVQNRAALISLVQSAEQAAGAYGDMHGSSEAGRLELIKLRKQIIDNAVAHGEDRKSVTDYINSILSIPKSVPPTAVDIKNAASAKIAAVQAQIAALRQDKPPLLKVDPVTAATQIARLQAQIDALHGTSVTIGVLLAVQQAAATHAAISDLRDQIGGAPTKNTGSKPHRVHGGRVYGPGSASSDSVPIMASAGEEVMNADATKKYGSIFDALNAGIPLQRVTAAAVPPNLPPSAKLNGTAGNGSGGRHVELHVDIHNPEPEPASTSLPDALRTAVAVAGTL